MIKTKYRNNMRTTQDARKKFLFYSWNFNNLWKRYVSREWIDHVTMRLMSGSVTENWQLSAIKGCDLSTRATYLRVYTVVYFHLACVTLTLHDYYRLLNLAKMCISVSLIIRLITSYMINKMQEISFHGSWYNFLPRRVNWRIDKQNFNFLTGSYGFEVIAFLSTEWLFYYAVRQIRLYETMKHGTVYFENVTC